jgi:hypothetical protein
MKSNDQIEISRVLEKKASVKNAKVLENKDENIFVCKQYDNECWQRYYSAIGDCV